MDPTKTTGQPIEGYPPSAGSVTLTYAELEAVLQECRERVQNSPGEDDLPDGYESLAPRARQIADECWHFGMEQLSTALLNYWYDHGASPVSPNTEMRQAKGDQHNE